MNSLEPLQDSLSVTGRVVIEVRDREGHLRERRIVRNTVTAAGKAHVADQLSATPTQLPMSNLAVGSGTPGSTALGTESFRKAFTSRTSSGGNVTYTGHWDIDDQKAATIAEAGLFNSANLGGIMLCSAVFVPPIVKGLHDSLDITWTVQLS